MEKQMVARQQHSAFTGKLADFFLKNGAGQGFVDTL